MKASSSKAVRLLALTSAGWFLCGAGTATTPAPTPAGSKAGIGGDEPLPKAAPRGDLHHVPAADLPPFLGVFGSSDLISKAGFHSKVGSYIDFEMQSKANSPKQAKSMRIAQIGPEAPDGRWIQLTASGGSVATGGIAFFATGLARGNVKRILFAGPAGIPMEMPMSSLTTDMQVSLPNAASGASLLTAAKFAGKETLTVPLGKFETEHWIVASDPKPMEVWTTKDPSVPFTGVVKIVTGDDTALATKAGTDAIATILIPQAQ